MRLRTRKRPSRQRATRGGEGHFFWIEYNAKGLKTRVTDPLGRETVYEYDSNEVDVLRIKQKNGFNYDLIETRTYNSQHLPLTITDAAGQTTTYTDNAAGKVLTVVTPPRGGLTLAQRTTTYAYDTNGYLQSVTGPVSGATISYTYDGYGRVRTSTDSDSYTLTYDYDALDRITRVTYPDATYEETLYNRLDPERERDRLGRWSATFYDALRRPVARRDALGRTTTQQWCTCGDLDRIINGNGNAITWERDLQSRVTHEIRADSAAWEYTYENTTSRLKQRKDPQNQIANYLYFLDNNRQQVSYSNAVVPTATVTFTYDTAYDRVATMTDGTGATVYAYNPVNGSLGSGQLASVDGPLTNDTVAYTYDELGQIATRGLSGFVSSFSHDALGRLTSLANAVGSFTYAYDGVTDRPLSLTYPNGQTTQYTYFPNSGAHRLQQIKHLAPGGAPTISKHDYTYDVVGNVATWTQQVGTSPAKVYTLGYDAADQLTTASVTGPTPLPIPSRFSYAYDAAGNRTAEQLNDALMGATYNSRNQVTARQAGGVLLFRGSLNEAGTVAVQGRPAQVAADNTFVGQAQVPSGTSNVVVAATDPSGNTRTNTYQVAESGSTTNYTYDARGNMTSDGSRTYEWDVENRLTAIVQGSHRSEFTYNGESERVRVLDKDGGTVTSDKRLAWCDSTICEERDGTGSVTKRYFGAGVQIGSSNYFYTMDHLGSIRELVDSTGAVRARYDYDPYGRTSKLSGDLDADLGFTGHYFHALSAIYLTQFRAYDTSTGRWLSEDPARDDLNFSRFVFGDPVGFYDPDGRQARSGSGKKRKSTPTPPTPTPPSPTPTPGPKIFHRPRHTLQSVLNLCPPPWELIFWDFYPNNPHYPQFQGPYKDWRDAFVDECNSTETKDTMVTSYFAIANPTPAGAQIGMYQFGSPVGLGLCCRKCAK